MKIETKFSVGDAVFILRDETVMEIVVTKILIEIEQKSTYAQAVAGGENPFDVALIQYRFNIPTNGYIWLPQSKVFKTKEELLNNL